MRMNELIFEGRPPIDAYFPGGFRVSDQAYTGGILLLPSGVVDLPAQSPNDLTVLATLLEAHVADIDVLLIGMGNDIDMLPPAVRTVLDAHNIGVEIMSTPAVCRTYNVLLSENRRVAAAILPVSS